jgi:hypothetical protein
MEGGIYIDQLSNQRKKYEFWNEQIKWIKFGSGAKNWGKGGVNEGK